MNKKLPSYEELFENLDFYSADESKSVLSPAAYLTDIMNLKDWDYSNHDAIDDRRDDISSIPLDAENTFTEIPHLDIANDIMERKVKSLQSVDDPYEKVLKNAKFPFIMPFNFHKTEINNILPYFKFDAAGFYKAFIAAPESEITAKEMLGLSEEEISVITTPVTDEKILIAYYGLKDIETLQNLVTPTVEESLLLFRKKTGLSAIQLSTLLFQNLSDAERAENVSRRFFINHTGAENQPYLSTTTVELKVPDPQDSKIIITYERQKLILTNDGINEIPGNIPAGYFDRIHRFIRLSMKTGLSFADLDQILMELCDKKLDKEALKVIAVVKQISEKFELRIEEVCALVATIKDYGMGETVNKTDMFNRLFNEEGRIADIRSIQPGPENILTLKNRIQASLECSEDEFLEITNFIPGTWTLEKETTERLAIIYKIKKLASLFDITVTSLLKFFAVIDKNMGLMSSYKFPVPVESDKLVRTCRDIITNVKAPTNLTTELLITEKLRLLQLTMTMMDWLIESEITIEQLEFICTEHSIGDVDGVMSTEDRNDLFRDLENQFRGVLFSAQSMQSEMTGRNTADRLFDAFSLRAEGIFTSHGLIRKTVTGNEIFPVYVSVIHDILFIEIDDINIQDKSADDTTRLELIFTKMKNKDYIDPENFISDIETNIDFFSKSDSLADFLDTMQSNSDAEKLMGLVFKAMSERAVSYKKAKENAVSECSHIAEKITVYAERQKTVLLRTLESGMGVSFEIMKILLNILFRTSNETEEMAIVRFIAPIFDGIANEESSGTLNFDASLVTSFRRMQQFVLLVLKCELTGKELEVLFDLQKMQSSLPEKIKLPEEFQNKIDSMYSDTSGDIVIFSGEKYIKYSGADYSIKASGSISEIDGIPKDFHSGINAALRDQNVIEAERKTYFFKGNQYIDKSSPTIIKDTATDWGKVRNNISEKSIVDAAYRSNDGKIFLFSGDQYIRYSETSRDFVDEGYPKNIFKCWNSEKQVKLPPEIRNKIDTIFNLGTKVYFFSGDKFIESLRPDEVLNIREHLGSPLNNIIINNKIDSAIVVKGKTFLFSGDQYIRYSSADYTFVDEGYPKKIAGNWSTEKICDLPEDFNTKVGAAFKGNDTYSYFFSGDTFVNTKKNSIPGVIKDKWGKVENNIKLNSKVDAALLRMGKTYLFSGNQYVRYSGSDLTFVDEGYPRKIAGNWNSIEECGIFPDSFNSSIAAAMSVSNNRSFIFSGNKYVSSVSRTIPTEINEHWGRVKNNIQTDGGIDAAFKSSDGKTYIFRGDQYYRYSGTDYQYCDEGYPKKIAGNWGLSGAFLQNIDAAFIFNVDGIDRLYLFSGEYYARYSSGNYSQPDSGYPKKLNDQYYHNTEGDWFNPIYYHGPDPKIKSIATIFTDRYNNKDRINYFYYDSSGNVKLMIYYYNTSHKHWDWDSKTFILAPFTTVDAGFMGADNNIYLFSGTKYAIRQGEYAGISTPADVKGTWGKVLNNFQTMNRVDSSFQSSNGKSYMFCGDQYVCYSGDINPGSVGFYVDEGYPKKIIGNIQNENIGVTPPATFTPQDMAILEVHGVVYLFNGVNFISSKNPVPAAISGVWGAVKNNFESLNRVDAATPFNNRTYLFSGDQYIRYSGTYDTFADEGYPKKIINAPTEDQLPGMMIFSHIDGLLDGADGIFYAFSGNKLISSSAPSDPVDVRSKFGIVKNNFASSGVVDAADTKSDGTVYFFSGDQYARYSGGIGDYADEGYPKSISNWKKNEGSTFPVSAEKGLKAVFTDGDGETYVFMDSKYFKLSNPSAELSINEKWGKVKNNLAETGVVDAAFIAPDGKTYLFTGDQYICYSHGKIDYIDEGFPKKIGDNWGRELPSDFRSGIDAGFVFDGRTYFFKGTQYVRYSDPACLKIDTGQTMTISSKMSVLPEFRIDDIKTFQQFEKLTKSFSSPDSNILNFFISIGSDTERKSLLSKITGWKSDDIIYLLNSGAVTTDSVNNLPDIMNIQTLSEMKSVFDISKKMGASPSTIIGEVWNRIYNKDTEDLKKGFELLYGFLKSLTETSSWKLLAAELHGKMNLLKRDALMGYLIHDMEQYSETSWIDNPRDLYEYLLIDVEMGEEATTSRIQEAIMCMQLFYHRTLMNFEYLEDRATGKDDAADTSVLKAKLLAWWKWMKNYRVWEANRKVFLYPENYIRPELRTDKSPEFGELEEDLLQNELEDASAEKAYKTYLDKYSEISKLKIAGGYVYQRVLDNSDDTSSTAEALNEKRIIMFGYSNTEPKKYYYMTGDVLDSDDGTAEQSIDWSPWNDIGITMDTEKVYPVFSFNKLFVFWVEIRERDQSTYKSSVGPEQKVTQYDPVIYYSFHNHNGEWTAPQKMFDIGAYIDSKAADKKFLFTENNTLGANMLPAREVLKNHANLYVTNPITRSHYTADEFVYIAFEIIYGSATFKVEGRFKSNFEFTQETVKEEMLDKLEKNIQFPVDKFGITPSFSNHWKGFFNDAFSAPWFNFSAEGGNFLLKPAVVTDAPVIKSDKKLYQNILTSLPDDFHDGVWPNLPDTGFTDQYNRQHLFFRKNSPTDSEQYYIMVDENDKIDHPVLVKEKWGKKNIFEWFTHNVDWAGVDAANGTKVFIVSDQGRFVSYTKGTTQIIDQETIEQTIVTKDVLANLESQVLPVGMTQESWMLIKENLNDFLVTLQDAFVCGNDLYLVACPEGDAVKRYTVPGMTNFWKEMAALHSDVEGTIYNWTSVCSATRYKDFGANRLYLTSGDSDVFIKDYHSNRSFIKTVAECSHPNLITPVYDQTPADATEIPWPTDNQDLANFIESLFPHITGVGKENGVIRFITQRPVPSNETSEDQPQTPVNEYTILPVNETAVNDFFTYIAGKIEHTGSPIDISGALNILDEADLDGSKLYVRSGDTVFTYNVTSATWSVDWLHPDVTSKALTTTGRIPTLQTAWAEVAEDFIDYCKTITKALVWKGVLYFITPKAGGGFEYSSPSAKEFWSSVCTTCAAATGLTTIDAACMIHEGSVQKLYVTSAEKVAIFDGSAWICQTIKESFGLSYAKINSIMEVREGTNYKVYIFSERQYAEKNNDKFVSAPLSDRWGTQPNNGAIVIDSAFMDNEHRVYLFSGTTFVRYSDVNNKSIDPGYPKDIREEFGIKDEEVAKEFSADKNSVTINSIKTNTAFDQMVNGKEKLYIFLDINATITTYVWRSRWVWQGYWTIRKYHGRWGWYHRWYRSYWGRWVQKNYQVRVDTPMRKSVYIRFSTVPGVDSVTGKPTTDYEMDDGYPKNITGNWSGLPGDFNKMITATFEDEEPITGVSDRMRKIFYAVRSLVDISGAVINDYVKYSGEENFPREISETQYEIIRLTSNTSEYFSQKLFTDGIGGLLTLRTQCVDEFPAFERKNDNIPEFKKDANGNPIMDETGNIEVSMNDERRDNTIFYNDTFLKSDKVPESKTLDFKSINAQYYWEIFFHAPFLIAQAFQNAQKFEQGKKWFEYVFNPTNENKGFVDNGLATKPYWQFVPFHKDVANNEMIDVNDARQYKRYLNDPFDPHAIAGLRQIAYRKAIVMAYINNLINWGDMYFRQYTRETINEARMLYVLAYDLLGKKPELLGTRKENTAKSYKQLRIDEGLHPELLNLENSPVNASVPKGVVHTPNDTLLDPYGYFYLPENCEFTVYWDTIIDRLTKIRYSLNIDGVKQSLALFEPPINPMALVQAVGSGAGLAQALADFNVAIPHYRFNFILGKARELTSRLTQFGQSLLSALEKKDAEELALLRNTHEKDIFKLTLEIKNAQKEDSLQTFASLKANLKSAKTRESYYDGLISKGLNENEKSQLKLLISSQVFSGLSQALSLAGGICGLTPEIGAFAFHWGGHNLNASMKGISDAFGLVSSQLSQTANIVSINGSHDRRNQDWKHQRRLAQCDIENIEKQIAGAEIKVKIAAIEIETVKKQMKNLESVDTFMKSKFTNVKLYRWMSSKLSGHYFQTYQMALDMAKAAQKSFQFELGIKEKDINFISSLYWDSLKKGLLAGETLQVDLDRMETAYIDRNKRRFEISKNISLAELDPMAFITLREKRVCEFSLGEEIFDNDFTGHYCRQIKNISITFPAVIGLYGNLNATLTQLSHRILLDPDKDGVEYLLNPNPKTDQPPSIRGDWRVNQQIALSRGVNDSGLFQLNFQDERYLPFEGTGAVSTWRLELNGVRSAFDVSTLSDVVLKIDYTALQGGDAFKAAVKKKLQPTPDVKMFKLAEDFSAEWNAFMAAPGKGLSVTMKQDMFTDLSGGKVTKLFMLYEISASGVEALGEVKMEISGGDKKITIGNGELVNLTKSDSQIPGSSSRELPVTSSGSIWKIVPASNPENFKPENIRNIMLLCTYKKKGEF